MTFSLLGVSPAWTQAAAQQGFAAPTPVQAAVIPALLHGSDVLACAQTGSGKTAAFALPLLQRLTPPPASGRRPVRALVLVPTRELAVQVGDVLRGLCRLAPGGPRVGVVFGGVSVNPQMLGLRGGADVLVATPGRLLDLTSRNAVSLDAVVTLVLDEADRLLDLGFAEELQAVRALLPPLRQTALFSATFPAAVGALAAGWLRDPVRIDIPDLPTTAPAITQRGIRVDAGRRTALLRHLLAAGGWDRALVFVATQYAAEHVAGKLYKAGLFATPLHGALAQGARQRALGDFRDGRWDVLVTTDLASRGLDIPQLPVVFNYDLPRSPVDHVHRIGRTGRAGESGVAISFVSGAAGEAQWRLIDKRLGLAVPLEVIDGFELATVDPSAQGDPAVAAPAGAGGVKGRRPSKKDKLRAAATAALAADPAVPE